ncbi:MAG TPA: RDD family protein [Acholeplasmataceae bacterium]|nr:RDD family protein [Acholeplasmataceae bacterium]
MTDNSRFTDKQIIKKYKRSILVDQFIVFVPMIVLVITIKTTTQFFGSFTNVFISLLFILIFGFYLTSDYFMNNSSIGKKIYQIEILKNDHTRKLLFMSVIMRRVMELTYHPFFNRDFISHSRKINSFTSTCVVQKAESHENNANIK